MAAKALKYVYHSLKALMNDPQAVTYDDYRAPHDIPSYRAMMSKYLGIIGNVINLNQIGKNEEQKNKIMDPVTKTIKSFYGKDTCDECKASTCDGERVVTINNNMHDFKIIDVVPCFLKGCTGDVYVLKLNSDLFLCFNIGSAYTLAHPEFETFEAWIVNSGILRHLTNVYHKHFYLMGHSHGMAAATYVSYMLMKYAIDPKFGSVAFPQELREMCQRVTSAMSVCGTAGFPVLFRSEEEFRSYYDYFKGRYLHVVISWDLRDAQGGGKIIMDSFANDIHEGDAILRNYKFALYTQVEPSNLGEPDEYKPVMCYVGMAINHVLRKAGQEPGPLADHVKLSSRFVKDMIHIFTFYRNVLKTYFVNDGQP